MHTDDTPHIIFIITMNASCFWISYLALHVEISQDLRAEAIILQTKKKKK